MTESWRRAMRKIALVAGLLVLSGPVMADPTVGELQEQIYQKEREMERLREENAARLSAMKWDMENERYQASRSRDESGWVPPPGWAEKVLAEVEREARLRKERCRDNRDQPVTVPDSWTPNQKC